MTALLEQLGPRQLASGTATGSRGSGAEYAGEQSGTANRDDPCLATTVVARQLCTPPGWPDEVLPPGVVDWEKSATRWLFDCCPADYRAYPVLSRHPAILARFAADFVEGQIRSSRAALTKARAALNDYIEPQVLESATMLLETEEARLIRTRQAVALIEEALRGKIFIQNLPGQ